jgi:thioredoxin reductase (NADPH)
VAGFEDGYVLVRAADTRLEPIRADQVFVLIGYEPEMDLLARAGVRIDPETLVPDVDPETCESNVPGLYVGGTLQAGRDTGRIFIENSRDHGERIVRRYVSCLEKGP